VIAGGAWVAHVTRGIAVARGEDAVGPNARVMKSYAGVVGFIYFLQVIFAFGISIYLLLSLIAPGVFGSIGSSRSGTLAALLDLPSRPPPPTVGGPGLTRLRDDHTERLRAIDRVHDQEVP